MKWFDNLIKRLAVFILERLFKLTREVIIEEKKVFIYKPDTSYKPGDVVRIGYLDGGEYAEVKGEPFFQNKIFSGGVDTHVPVMFLTGRQKGKSGAPVSWIITKVYITDEFRESLYAGLDTPAPQETVTTERWRVFIR